MSKRQRSVWEMDTSPPPPVSPEHGGLETPAVQQLTILQPALCEMPGCEMPGVGSNTPCAGCGEKDVRILDKLSLHIFLMELLRPVVA